MNVLAIDIGSSSARVMVVNCEADYELEELLRVSHTTVTDGNGCYRWSIIDVFTSLKTAIDNALNDYNISSIGICSWGVDYGVIGSNGELIDLPYSYRDGRCTQVISNMDNDFADYAMFENAGIYPNAINTVYQLISDKQIGRYDDNSGVKIAMIADLFAYFLTGNIRAELSNASTTGLLSKTGLDWDFELICKLGLSCDIFPNVIRAGECYGKYNGVNVTAVPTHDTASAIHAMGEMNDTTAFVSSGSWLLVGKVVNSPIISRKVYDIGYTNERIYNNKVSLLSNINGLYILQRIVVESGISYCDIDNSMESASVLGTLNVDELMSPDDMIGNIEQMLGVENANIMDIVKTAYHALATRLVVAINDIGIVTGSIVRDIIMTGGAIRAKYFLNTITSISGIRITLLSGEGAIRGNAMVQVKSYKESNQN